MWQRGEKDRFDYETICWWSLFFILFCFVFVLDARGLNTLSDREDRTTGRHEIEVDGWNKVLKEVRQTGCEPKGRI